LNEQLLGIDPGSLQTATNWSAGIGDKVSKNLDKHLRQEWGYDDGVDYKSGEYEDGQEWGQNINNGLNALAPLARLHPGAGIPFAIVKGIQAAGEAWDANDALNQNKPDEAANLAMGAMGDLAQGNAALDNQLGGQDNPANPGSCFPAGTLVATLIGLQAIETIKMDDEVWGFDLVASEWRPCKVRQTIRRDYHNSSVFVTVAGETIESTELHPYWVIWGEELERRPRRRDLASVPEGATTQGRWVDATDVRVGDELLLRDGRIVPVEAVRREPYEGDVFNFLVGGLNCYAIGYNGVLMHNGNGDADNGGLGDGGEGTAQPGPPENVGPENPGQQLTPEQQRSINSYRELIEDHRQRLEEFRQNPTVRPGMEGLPQEVIEQQQQRRIEHLEQEIQTFEENIEKILRGELKS
jgi:hypothetical protein